MRLTSSLESAIIDPIVATGLGAIKVCYIIAVMDMRLIWAILSTILEEAAFALIVIFLLPRWDIEFPLPLLIIILVIWSIVAATIYIAGTQALKRKPLKGLTSMVGLRGVVIQKLSPKGLIRIEGEIWQACSSGGEIAEGEEVEVIEQHGLKLKVRKH